MILQILFIILFVNSISIQYIPRETKTQLELDNGYFYIKAPEYEGNYIYLNFKAKNIMLDNLKVCDYEGVPTDDSPSECEFITLYPFNSKYDKDTNTTFDCFRFEKYTRKRNFIIIKYSGVKSSTFELEVCIDDDDNGGNTTNITLIVVFTILGLAIIIGIIIFVFIFLKKKSIINSQISNSEPPNASITSQDSLVNQ